MQECCKSILFQITRDPAHPPDLRRIAGGTVQPEPFVCVAKKRY